MFHQLSICPFLEGNGNADIFQCLFSNHTLKEKNTKAQLPWAQSCDHGSDCLRKDCIRHGNHPMVPEIVA